MSDSSKGPVDPPIPITVEFTYDSFSSPCALTQQFLIQFYSGGLELLFGNERKHKVSLPARMEDGNPTNIAYLLPYLVDNLMQDQRKEMFIMEDNVYVKSKLLTGIQDLQRLQTTRYPRPDQRCRLGTRRRGEI